MGQPLYSSAAEAGMWGERGYGDGSLRVTQQHHLASMAAQLCFTQAFPTTISSFPSPQSTSPQSTAALALGLLYSP